MKESVLARSRRRKLEVLVTENRLAEAKHYCEKILRSGRKDPKILVQLGLVLRRQGDHVDAEQQCRAALRLNPNLALAYQVLGTALQCQGKADKAIQSYRQAIRLKSDFTEAYYLLGNILREQGLLTQAAEQYHKVLEIDPNNVPALCNIGGTLTGLFLYKDAFQYLNKANQLQPGATPVLCNIARVLQLTGKTSEAENQYREALRHDPGAVDVMNMLSELLEKSNRLDEAGEIVKKGLDIAPDHAGLLLVAAKLSRRDKRYTDAIAIAENALKGLSLDADKKNELHHLLGLLYDREGDTTCAFEHFTEGNSITALAVSDKSRHSFLHSIDQYRDDFRAAIPSLSHTSGLENASIQLDPIFLVGFPRSGTTLLEQVLDSHPRLCSLDERPTVGAMMETLESVVARRSDARNSLTDAEREEVRRSYFKRAAEFVSLEPGQLIVDKFPLNLINAWHIWQVFPNAKFILAIRHPCDVCLSCFMQNFALNEAMTAFTNLDDTANLYASALSLWQEFTENLPLSYHMLRYEDLVDNVEQEARRLLDFLELEWSDEVLNHVEHARQRGTISTPSYHQVTQPIYRTARYRWKRYASYLEPEMDTLRPFIKRFGY